MDRTLLSLEQAVSIARSRVRGQKRWPPPRGEEIKKLRQRLKLSQAEFARRFGLDLASLKNWENERRIPEQGNCLLLQMIDCDPKAVEKLVHHAEARSNERNEQTGSKELEPA